MQGNTHSSNLQQHQHPFCAKESTRHDLILLCKTSKHMAFHHYGQQLQVEVREPEVHDGPEKT